MNTCNHNKPTKNESYGIGKIFREQQRMAVTPKKPKTKKIFKPLKNYKLLLKAFVCKPDNCLSAIRISNFNYLKPRM